MLGDLLRLELDYLPDATYLQSSEMVSRDLRQEMIGFIIEVLLCLIYCFHFAQYQLRVDRLLTTCPLCIVRLNF